MCLVRSVTISQAAQMIQLTLRGYPLASRLECMGVSKEVELRISSARENEDALRGQ
jgi:hypothetical protein